MFQSTAYIDGSPLYPIPSYWEIQIWTLLQMPSRKWWREGGNPFPQLSDCTLANTAQCHHPVLLDEHTADSCSARLPGPPSIIVQRFFLASSAQAGLCGVIPSQLHNFALVSNSCLPLRSDPASPGIYNKQKGWSGDFYSYVHYNCARLLMFSLSEMSKCVKLICPGLRKINYSWGSYLNQALISTAPCQFD